MLTSNSLTVKRLLFVAALSIVAAVGGAFAVSRLTPAPTQDLGHGGPLESINYVAAIGSVTSPVTLTTSYAGASSTTILAMGLPNITIAGTYTPKSHGSQVLMLLERSVDNGVSFQPYTVLEPQSTQTLVHANGTGTTSGIPFVFPSTNTSASGTALGFSFDMSVVADYIRFSAREATTSTAGTFSLRTVFTSN